MKYYKIFSKACTMPHPVQDVTYKKDEVLRDAIDYLFDSFLDSNGTTIAADESIKRLYDSIMESEYPDDDMFNAIYEKIADILTRAFSEIGTISAGDWGLVALEDDEDPWEYRPNRW